ncbi:MAG: copper resistance protein NlpE, partial [Bacteroidales bacterium]|uniref:copper resistance protein NlpE n=1 Tax=Porphyromonas sp. TaxID=1924944 RepID=UPI002970B0BD
PCADCEGILTKLTIREDTTYDLSSEYLGKKDGKFEVSGVYELNGDVLTLITPSSGEKTYYKVLEGSVALVDSTGVLNTGELASQYILTKLAE